MSVRRQRVAERAVIQRAQDRGTDRGLGNAGGGGVDRGQRIRQGLVRLHEAVAGVCHLGAEEPRAHLAERAQQPALLGGALELLELAAPEIEEAQHQAFGVDEELAPRAVDHLGAQYPRLDLDRRARRRLLRIG